MELVERGLDMVLMSLPDANPRMLHAYPRPTSSCLRCTRRSFSSPSANGRRAFGNTSEGTHVLFSKSPFPPNPCREADCALEKDRSCRRSTAWLVVLHAAESLTRLCHRCLGRLGYAIYLCTSEH